MESEPSLRRHIPVTARRHFYWLLRRFPSQAFHMQAAKECLRRPEQLDELVAESVSHFAAYDNRGEGFHSRKESSLSAARLASSVAANGLVQRISSSGGQVISHPELDFDFVDYEISPLRTTHSDLTLVRLTSFNSNGPECSPTRTALLTGRYQQRVGGLECAIGLGNVGRYDDAIRLANQHELGLPVERSILARALKDAGYATAICGKWHLGYEPKFLPLKACWPLGRTK